MPYEYRDDFDDFGDLDEPDNVRVTLEDDFYKGEFFDSSEKPLPTPPAFAQPLPPTLALPKRLPEIKPIHPKPVKAVFLVFLVSFLSSLAVAIFSIIAMPSGPITNYGITLLSDIPVIIVSAWILFQWVPWKPKVMPITLVTLFEISGIFAVIWLAGQAAGVWLNLNFQDSAYADYTQELSSMTPILYFALTLIVAPIMEELFFRGVVLRAFSFYITPFWAIVFQALVFGAMHLTIVHLIPTILLGIFNGWVAYRTGKLWPCMLCHSANNLFALFAINRLYQLLPWLFNDVLAWVGTCIVAAGVVLLCIDEYQRDGGLLVKKRPTDFAQVANDILDSNGNPHNPWAAPEAAKAHETASLSQPEQLDRTRRYDVLEDDSGTSQDPWPY